MSIKMVVADIDRTILDCPDYALPSENVRKTIQRLQASGVKVRLASSRNIDMAAEIQQFLGVDGVNIYTDGANIRSKTQLVAQFPLSGESMRLCQKFEKQFHAQAVYYTARGNFMVTGSLLRPAMRIALKSSGYKKFVQIGGKKLYDELFENLDTYRVMFVCLSKKQSQKKYDKFRMWIPKFPEKIETSRSMDKVFGVCRMGVSKGSAIKTLAEHEGIDLHDVLAIGDSENDIEMIKAAGIGVAMGNGSEELKRSADFVTDSVSDDGFCRAIEKLIFNTTTNNIISA